MLQAPHEMSEKRDRITETKNVPFFVGNQLVLSSTFKVSSEHGRPSGEDSRSSSVVKSQSIPIESSMKRTPSELKLLEDEEVADIRDYVMFSRIFDRISRQQRETKDYHLRHVNDMCLAHLIGVRTGSSDQPNPAGEAENPTLMDMWSTQHNIPNFADIKSIFSSDPDDDAMFVLDL
jgi:hypothetical protein